MTRVILMAIGLLAGLALVVYGATGVYLHYVPDPTAFEEGRMYGAGFRGVMGLILILAVVKTWVNRSRSKAG